jgi:predicted DNA-binding transcriptional regulator AlpA
MLARVHHLVGVAEICVMLDLSRQRVDMLTRRDDFPAPVADLRTGRVWETDDVKAWAARQVPPRKVFPVSEERTPRPRPTRTPRPKHVDDAGADPAREHMPPQDADG